MTEQLPQSFESDNPLMSGLTEQGVVEPNRRLISPEVTQTEAVDEYINPLTKERLIAIDESNDSVALHHQLARRSIPVFPILRTERGKVLLDIPAEARSVRSSLRFFSRDIAGYAPTFRQLGNLVAQLQASGFGLPESTQERGVLNGLAVAEEANKYGSGLILVPPYKFDKSGTKRDFLEILREEFTISGHFTPVQTDFMMGEIAGGWDEFRH